jgi:hypothetical protein
MLVWLGLTLIVAVVAPVLHEYDPAPLAVKITLPPVQIKLAFELTFTLGLTLVKIT